MILSQLSLEQVRHRMAHEGVAVDLGIATFNIKSTLAAVVENFYTIYASHRLLTAEQGVDFYIRVKSTGSIRRWLKPQVEFVCDQNSPFYPLPKSQAYPLLEWGMNWCIASHCHQYLLIHAAVLAKGDKAILFPAPPGSGKSTLTSYLAHTGWRLLSDEMAVIDTRTLEVMPFIRPICLKNNSIELVKSWFSEVVVSRIARDTSKGDVAHVKPPIDSLEAMYETARIKAVVFPTYDRSTELDIYRLNICDAFFALNENAFNNNVLAADSFQALTKIAEQSNAYELKYSDMQALVTFLQDEIQGQHDES